MHTAPPFNAPIDIAGIGGDADGNGTFEETHHWIYDANQPVLQFDGDTASDLSHRYLWGPAVDQLLADETADNGGPEDILWPLTDWQGSLRHLAQYNASTDTTTVANEKFYDAYGNVTSESNSSVDTVFGWTGRFFDDDTGLQWNLNRWYDPKTGRWLSEDPIGFEARDPNLYRYVGNSPGMGVDPDGLEEDEPSFWDFDGRLFESEPSYFEQHGGAPGDRRGVGQVLDEHAQRGCGSLTSGDGDALGHMNLHQSAAKSDFAAAAWNELAVILDEIMWEVATAGIGHGVGATVEVIQRGKLWWKRSEIVVRRGEKTIALTDDQVQRFWKHEKGLGREPSSLQNIAKALQKRIDDSSCTTRFSAPSAATHAAQAASRLHHSWPKYLGGVVKQKLQSLPKAIHDAYHSGLDKILPRQIRGGATKYYRSLPPAEQAANFQKFMEYTKGFDAKHGTQLWEAVVDEATRTQ